MKAISLTSSAREPSRDVCGNLAELDDQAFTRLTMPGPAFDFGPITLSAEAFCYVIDAYVWTALSLHQCAHWGACDQQQAVENDEQLTLCGSVCSRWFAEDTVEFTIETTLEPGCEQTTVRASAELWPVCESPSSVFQLGDVQLEDSVQRVPLRHIWSALHAHRLGSPGNSELLPRRTTFRPGDTAVSWWGPSGGPELGFPPFWVLTHIAEPRLTHVFAGATDSAL